MSEQQVAIRGCRVWGTANAVLALLALISVWLVDNPVLAVASFIGFCALIGNSLRYYRRLEQYRTGQR
jgi:hypothetical protein